MKALINQTGVQNCSYIIRTNPVAQVRTIEGTEHSRTDVVQRGAKQGAGS